MDIEKMIGQTSFPSITPIQEEKILGVLAHALAGITWIIAPLMIYFLKRNESLFATEHAKESLNFQLTLSILFFIFNFIDLFRIGPILVSILGTVEFIVIVIASYRAYEGKLYRYPFNFRFFK